MKNLLNLKVLPDDINEEKGSSRAQNKRTSVENGKSPLKVNFLDNYDPDILSMPVLSFEKADFSSHLTKPSQLAESWNLISKDILSPFGIKHRSIIKHQLEQEGKKKKKFVTSAVIEKELKRKNLAKGDKAETQPPERVDRVDDMKRKVTWFSRSSSPIRKPVSKKNTQIIEVTDPDEKAPEPPAETMKNSHKTAGQIATQQMLNMSWDNPPVVSLWDLLDAADEGDRKKPLPKLTAYNSLQPPKSIAASRRITPIYSQITPKNIASVRPVRRKSCECLLCGGISNLEVRTSHIHYEVQRPEHNHKSRISIKDIQMINQTLRFANLAHHKKRDSGTMLRVPSTGKTMTMFRSTRNVFGTRSGGLTLVNSPAGSIRGKRKDSEDPSEVDSAYKLQSSTVKDGDMKDSQQISNNSMETPDPTPKNNVLKVLDFAEASQDKNGRSQFPSMNEIEEESPQSQSITKIKSTSPKNFNYKLKVEPTPTIKLSRWKGARHQPDQEGDSEYKAPKINTAPEADKQVTQSVKEDQPNSDFNSGTNTIDNSPTFKLHGGMSRTLFDLTSAGKEEGSPTLKKPKLQSIGSIDYPSGLKVTPVDSQEQSAPTAQIGNSENRRTAEFSNKKQDPSKEVRLVTISESPLRHKFNKEHIDPTFSGSTLPSTQAKKNPKRSLSTPKQHITSSSDLHSAPTASSDRFLSNLRNRRLRNNKSLSNCRPNTSTAEDILRVYKTSPSALEESPIKPERKSGSPIRHTHIRVNSNELPLKPILERNRKSKGKYIRLIRGQEVNEFLKNYTQTTFHNSYSQLYSQERSKDMSLGEVSKVEKQGKSKPSRLEFSIPLIDVPRSDSRNLLSRSSTHKESVSQMITVYKTLHNVDYTKEQKQVLEKIFPMSRLSTGNMTISKRSTAL